MSAAHQIAWRDHLARRRHPIYAALVHAAGQMRDNAETFVPRDKAETGRAEGAQEIVIGYLVADGAQPEAARAKAIDDIVRMAMAIRRDHNPNSEPGCVCPLCQPELFDALTLYRRQPVGHARARAAAALGIRTVPATTEG